jgi:hypothetical protein
MMLTATDKKTGQTTTKDLEPVTITKEEFGLAPAPGEDHSDFPQN